MVTTIDIKDIVSEAVCRYYLSSRRRSDDSTKISVSEALQCLRRSFYDRTNPMCSINIASMEIGTAVHRAVLERLADYGFVIEVPVSKRYGDVTIVGRVDAYHPDLDVIIELKVVSKKVDEPPKEHMAQVSIYMDIVGCRRGYIAYLSTDPRKPLWVYEVRKNRHLVDWVVERARKLSHHLREGTEPLPEPSPLCAFCPYASMCKPLLRRKRFK